MAWKSCRDAMYAAFRMEYLHCCRCPDNNTLRGQFVDAKNLRFQLKKHEYPSTFPETFLQIAFAHATHLE
nr:hypothetical protein [Tanacetum cinerariifolium]